LGGRLTNTFDHHRWFSIPVDWECLHIGEFAEQSSLRNTGGTQLPVLSCTKYDGLVDSLTYFGRRIYSEDTSNYRIVQRGEFAYATNHLEEGSIGYLDFLDAGLISPMYTVFRTDKAAVNDHFLLKVFKTAMFLHIFQANTSSSVDRRGGLRWEDFARLRVPMPSLDEQGEIDEVLTDAKRAADLHRKELASFQTQKRGLMQKLLTGEWRAPLSDSEVGDLAERAATGEAA
jgi:type I restriction enzyme S subunit